MGTGRFGRLAPLAGVVFTVLFAIGFLSGGDTPDVKSSGQDVIAHYDSEGKVRLVVILLMLAALALMFFAGVLRTRLRAAGDEWLASVAFGGSVIYTLGLSLFGLTQIAMVDASKLGQPEVAQALNILDNDNFLPSAIGVGVVLLATGWHVLARRSLPIWIGWVSVVLGVFAFAGPLGFLAFLLFPIWVAIVAVTMYRQPGIVAAVA
jgi:hypothetical protein